MDWQALYQAACDARERSYSPYSKFRVGAALLLDDGTIVSGCNVENRSYGLTICAERNAVAQAVARGRRDGFRAIAVVTDTSPPAVPCGMCLETLTEFARDLPVLIANLDGERRELTLRQLHPVPFEWPEGKGDRA